jgi:hypothetical protein
MSPSVRQRIADSEFYEPYAYFSKTVRAWFIAFGVGVPVLFLSNREVWSALRTAAALRSVIELFLVGVGIQVLLGLLYRSAMWYLYVGQLGNLQKTTYRYRVADWVSDQHWPEVLADLATLALFVIATLRMLDILCG